MIVDFTQIKIKLDKIAHAHIKLIQKREDSFLNQMRLHLFHEGHGQWSFQTVDNETIEQSAESFQSAFNISREEIKNLRISDALQLYEKIVTDLASQKKKHAIQRLNEVTEKTGNIVNTQNKTFAEVSLEMLEKIYIEFDDTRDKPHISSILVHPNDSKKLIDEEKAMSEEDKLNYAQRKEKILNRKYEEYLLRESNRKLVD